MEVLLYVYIGLALAALVGTYLLFKNDNNTPIFVVDLILVLVFSFLAFSSLPSNFVVQRVIVFVWPVLALIATVLKFNDNYKSKTAEILLTIALFASLAQTLII